MKHPNASGAYERLIFAALCVAIGIVVSLAGCQNVQPVPTPTPTRTPILPTATPTLTPTPTPTLTPSPTPTPSPTLPPSLVIPAGVQTLPSAETGELCPALPADLLFIREGSLWVCPAEGGSPQAIPVPPEAGRITAYQLTPDGRHIAYVTEAGELFVVDRAPDHETAAQQTRIPTSGRLIDEHGAHFALTQDGTTLFYLAWGVHPSSGPDLPEPGTGTLLSLAVTDPRGLQQVEALCQGGSGQGCGGFLLSPTEEYAAFVDARGVWSVPIEPAPGSEMALQRSRVALEARQLGVAGNHTVRLHSWSPDGAWLLLEQGSGPTASLLLLSHAAESVALGTVAPSAFCGDDCMMATSWNGDRLWILWDTGAQGCLQVTETRDLAGPIKLLHPQEPVCQAGSIPLHPRSPRPFADSGMNSDFEDTISFLQPAVPGIWSGLYTYSLSGELTPLVLLPEADGTLVWAPDGEAFLYIDGHQSPAYLGTFPTSALWDVRALLQGAHSFTWGAGLAPVGDE